MYQTLALSPLAFEQLDSEDTKTILNFFSSLDTEIILCDKNKYVFDEYVNIVSSNSNPLLEVLVKDFINKSCSMGKVKAVDDVKSFLRNNEQLADLKTELALINEDVDWKIILTNLSTKLKFNFSDYIKNIEFASPKDYIAPDENSNIIGRSDKISKARGDNFNLIKWLTKFLICAEFIEIYDGYLVNNRALNNLDKIFDLVKTINHYMPIKIITLSDGTRNKNSDNDGIEVLERIEVLKEKHTLKNLDVILISNKRDLTDRKLVTDKFTITLGHSLDAVRSDNYVVKQFDIQSSHI